MVYGNTFTPSHINFSSV